MSVLLVDAGNSRIKWALAEAGAAAGDWRREGVCASAAAENLIADWADVSLPARILISNVAGEAVAQSLLAACAVWPQPVEFIRAEVQQAGVTNAYQLPQQLGSDRWAGLIAAWHAQRRACLVVNCGTATTIDALSSAGEFLGGLILPGLALMQRSLQGGTAQLRQADGRVCDWPCNTADGMASGALAATLGAIERQYRLLAQPQAVCVLSGGAAPALVGALNVPVWSVENLVLRGLQVMAEEETSC